MTAALSTGIAYPPVRDEFDPPESVDWSMVEDETLRELLKEEMRLRNYWLQGLWEQISKGINWAGARRVEDGHLYRWDDDADAWLSFARPVFLFGKESPANPVDQLEIVGGVVTAANSGYYLPQDCTVVRWWASWVGAAPANFALNLRRTGATILQTWTSAAGGETSMSEDVLVDVASGQVLTADVAVNTTPATKLSIGVEVAWRTTFPA